MDFGGALTLNDVTISNGFNGDSDGGAIINLDTLVVQNAVVQNSQTGLGHHGGGIFSAGTLTLTGSIVRLNRATLDGGGVVATGIQTLVGTSVISNTTGRDGGWLYVSTSSVLDQVTVLGNHSTASKGYGGGIYAFSASSLLKTDGSLRGNSAYYGGGKYSASNSHACCK